MRIAQYVYFGIRSDTVTPQKVTAALLVEPDESWIRGEKDPDRVIPRHHGWYVRCDLPGLCVDDQFAAVMQRMTPALPALDRLLDDQPDITTVVRVVRKFGEGEEEEVSDPDDRLQKLAGQHQLLGWHLDRAALDFIQRTRAELDVDEYG